MILNLYKEMTMIKNIHKSTRLMLIILALLITITIVSGAVSALSDGNQNNSRDTEFYQVEESLF